MTNKKKTNLVNKSELKIVLKKSEPLYEADYKQEYKIIFNPFSEGYSVALLTSELYDVFQFVDGIKTIADIIKIFKTSREDAEEFVLYSLDYLRTRNAIYTPDIQDETVDFAPNDIQVWVHVTNQCNLRCVYCFLEHTPKKMEYEDGKKYFTQIFKILQKKGVGNVTFKFCGGEPLLNFETIKKLVEFTKETAPKYDMQVGFAIITNGTLLTKEKAEFLKENKFIVIISLDGIEEVNDKSRYYIEGKGSFKNIIKGVNILEEVGNNYGISTVASPMNVNQLYLLVEFLLENKMPVGSFTLMRENPYCSIFGKINKEEFVKGIRKALQIKKENVDKIRFRHLELINIEGEPKMAACGGNHNYFAISQDGYIAGCQFLLHQQENKYNIMDENIDDKLIMNKDLDEIFCSCNEKETCKDCIWCRVCAGGCPVLTYKTYGTAKRPSPHCEIIKELMPDILEIEAERILKFEEYFQDFNYTKLYQ